MNNEQFRRLVAATSAKSPSDSKNDASSYPTSRPSAAAALGSRLRSSIPMTPRSVAGRNPHSDFTRQVAERNSLAPAQDKKKAARISAPKGVKLAAGYVDRAKARQEQAEEDERTERLNALEEAFKKDEIDQETYDRLRGEIAGGDLSSTHLVKGLDFKLLEKIRRGEDVSRGKEGEEGRGEEVEGKEQADQKPDEDEDPDDVLERLEAAEVKAIEREKVQKKGQVATTALNPGQKRTRAQIIAELKATREAAKAKKPESTLGSRFKKIGAKQTPGTRIEKDGKGREIMIIVDEDGHERRKVRRINPTKAQEEQEREAAALAQSKVLGMEVPEFYRKQQEEELRRAAEEEAKEPTIFDDVGSDYDPLAGLEDSDSDSSDDGDEGEVKAKPKDKDTADMPPPPVPKPSAPPAQRNYFKDAKTSLTSEETYKAPSLNDPSFIAALKKAKAISAAEKSEEEQRAAEREQRLRKKLQESNRDDDDLDLGFGSSRVEDEADMEDGGKVKLSEWKGAGGEDDYDDDGGGEGGGGKSKRKRGGKKRKGDKNSFADVMAVMERKKASGGGSG